MSLVTRSALLAGSLLLAGAAQAQLITNGFTFSVASAPTDLTVGTHYHSNTGGAFGNPAGKAEVGRYSTEEVRGLSEYNLTGLAASPTAFFTLTVFKQGGLFAGVNDLPFTGRILIDAYVGNNLEDISDYQATSLGSIGSFQVTTAPLSPGVGASLSFNMTALFNAAIARGDRSIGIRLREDPTNAAFSTSSAWTFQDFRLTVTPVPEPGTAVMLSAGIFATLCLMRRKRCHVEA